MSGLLDYHDALDTLLGTHAPLAQAEDVPLGNLDRRVLARDVFVQHDVPAFDNSSMDGYAICGNDCGRWRLVRRIAAGDAGAEVPLQPGQAARIFTGAPVPAGTTAVLMQEHVQCHDDETITVDASRRTQAIGAGLNIRRRAEELRAGDVLLPRGHRLAPAAVGLLAGQGYARAPCVAQLRVTVFSSGNELLEPGAPPSSGKIHDSNRPMLMAMLRREGFAVTDGGILPDDYDCTREALARAAAHSDAILCSGGVSVGEEDHLKAALTAAGELIQWRLFIKPGKPFTWGRVGACRVFLLPGNSVSSFVTFRLLALPALLRLAGLDQDAARPRRLPARADFERRTPEPRREFLRVTLHAGPDGWRVRPLQHQGSAMLSAAAFADALAEIPPGAQVEPGMPLVVYPLDTRC